MRFLDSLYKENIFIPNCVYILKKLIFFPPGDVDRINIRRVFFLMDVVFNLMHFKTSKALLKLSHVVLKMHGRNVNFLGNLEALLLFFVCFPLKYKFMKLISLWVWVYVHERQQLFEEKIT